MFKFSRAFERMMHSREQEARRQIYTSLPDLTNSDLSFSDGVDARTARSKGF